MDNDRLPDAVRVRVVTLVSEAIGQMGAETLPAPLRKVKEFAPARRAKLAGSQILQIVDRDPAFRDHVAAQVRVLREEIVAALARDDLGGTDVDEVAAVAYVLRVDHWWDHVAVAADAQRGQSAERAAEDDARRTEQLQISVSTLEDARTRLREQVTTLKGENADLRRKLGEARAQARAAQETAERAQEDRASLLGRLEHAEVTAEAEARRLRGRLDQLEQDLRGARRREREGREDELVRARLLLDTVIDAAQGLRRELALPPVEGSPAERVAAQLADPAESVGTPGGSGVDEPSLLDRLLRMPRAHLIVDGYNVTKFVWPELTLERQRSTLLSGLAPLGARTGAEVTVVFDAADVSQRPVVAAPRGVRVLFSPLGVIADDVIRDLVAAEPSGRVLLVVSGDQEVVRRVSRDGARPVGVGALRALLPK